MVIIKKIRCKIDAIISNILNKTRQKRWQKKLTNDKFSILCPTCIGGIIYHRLNKQFLSPTINMWMHQYEFLIFLEHLEECLASDIHFVETDYTFPVAEILCSGGSVRLYFNHANSAEEAQNDWYKRRSRVQLDNLYIIMYDLDGITEDDFMRLKKIPCQNKVVLSKNQYPHIPFVKTIVPNPNSTQTNFLDKDRYGIRTFEKQFDFVEFLNTKNT